MCYLDGPSMGALACTGSAASDMIDAALGREKKTLDRNATMAKALAAVVHDAIGEMAAELKKRPVKINIRQGLVFKNTLVTHSIRMGAGDDYMILTYGIIPWQRWYGFSEHMIKAFWFVNITDTSSDAQIDLLLNVIRRVFAPWTTNASWIGDVLVMREIAGTGVHIDWATSTTSMTGPAPTISAQDMHAITRLCAAFVERASIASAPPPEVIHGSETTKGKAYFDRACKCFADTERVAERYNIRYWPVSAPLALQEGGQAQPTFKSSRERVLIKGNGNSIVYRDSQGMRFVLLRGAYTRIEDARRHHARTFAVMPTC